MWQSLKLLSCLVAVAAASRSSDGTLFLYDAEHEHTTPQGQDIIREDAARLLLQQRLLSPQTTPSTALEEPIVELLNKYGGNQHELFSEVPTGNQKKLLIIVEGLIKDAAAISPQNPTVTLNVPQTSTEFVDSFIAESVYGSDARWKHCEYATSTDSDLQAFNSNEFQSCLYQHPVYIGSPQQPLPRLFDDLPLSSLEAWSDAAGSNEILRLTFREHLKDPSRATQLLVSISEQFDGEERTIFLTPHKITNTKLDELTAKKYLVAKPTGLRVHSRGQQQQSGDLLSTLMPVCHITNDSCVSATNACSGHGKCYLKSAVKDNECYACKCDSQWGGPACQKIDISTQFFLIGTVTILAILAIGGAIGMLFSVGQEELPSVISAGVSSAKTSR